MTNNKRYRFHNITLVLYLLSGWIHSPKLKTESVPIIHFSVKSVNSDCPKSADWRTLSATTLLIVMKF